MKKKLWIVLALMLALFAVGCAAEEAPGMVVQSSCNIVQSGEYYLVYCYAQVHNNSDQVICLDEGTYYLSDGDQILSSEKVSQLWPYFLAPGEDGYLFDIVSFEPNEDGAVVPHITNLSYDLHYMEIDPVHAGIQLQTQARIETNERSGEMSVILELTNPTHADVLEPTAAFGLYTAAGQMVYADGLTLKGVGIPADGTILAYFEVEKALSDQWLGYGAVPEHVRVNAMFRGNED